MRIPARKSSMANATICKIALMKITINKMGFVSNKLHAIILKLILKVKLKKKKSEFHLYSLAYNTQTIHSWKKQEEI